MSIEKNKHLDFCLLIPCYNNFGGLIKSLKSVVYPEDKFLILVIDDGSVQPIETEKIKKEIGDRIPITILFNEQNQGITKTLNKGLEWIEQNTSAKYIARLDCGDICSPDRFDVQVNYMNTHPEIGLLGSWCRFERMDGLGGYAYKTPTEHKAILKAMHFRNVFIHPTVMFKATLLAKTGFYNFGYEYAEDYALFWEMIKLVHSAILDKCLVVCEINTKGISIKNKSKQLAARWKVVNTFSTNPLLYVAAFLRLMLLFILPKELALQLKRMKG